MFFNEGMGPRSRDHGVANVEAGMSLLGLQTYPRNHLKVCPVIWNKFGVSSAFCTDIGTWVLRFERSFVLQRYAFRCIAKQGRRSLHRIMGRWLWLNGMGCHQCYCILQEYVR
ncbi:hypothetical protein YC2023_082883 [Brassica napus]